MFKKKKTKSNKKGTIFKYFNRSLTISFLFLFVGFRQNDIDFFHYINVFYPSRLINKLQISEKCLISSMNNRVFKPSERLTFLINEI